MNLSKYAFMLVIFWSGGLNFFDAPDQLSLTNFFIGCALYFPMVIGITCFLVISGWTKWRGRSEEIDEVWRQTADELGLTLTLTPFYRQLRGRYLDVDIEVTDRYAALASILGRKLGIAGRMAGVTVRLNNAPRCSKTLFMVAPRLFFSKDVHSQWSAEIAKLPQHIQQRLNRIVYYAGLFHSLSASPGIVRFVCEAFVSDSEAQESHDTVLLPLRQVIDLSIALHYHT